MPRILIHLTYFDAPSSLYEQARHACLSACLPRLRTRSHRGPKSATHTPGSSSPRQARQVRANMQLRFPCLKLPAVAQCSDVDRPCMLELIVAFDALPCHAGNAGKSSSQKFSWNVSSTLYDYKAVPTVTWPAKGQDGASEVQGAMKSTRCRRQVEILLDLSVKFIWYIIIARRRSRMISCANQLHEC